MMLHNMLGGWRTAGRPEYRCSANRYRSETYASPSRGAYRRKRPVTVFVRSDSSLTRKALANIT
jgi:hypothetical protein